MNKPLTHADIGRLWDEVGGPKLTSEQWSAMHRFCPRLLKEAAPPPQAAPKAGESATVALEDAASAFVNLSCKLPSGDFDAELMADALNRLRAALAALAAAPSAPQPNEKEDER